MSTWHNGGQVTWQKVFLYPDPTEKTKQDLINYLPPHSVNYYSGVPFYQNYALGNQMPGMRYAQVRYWAMSAPKTWPGIVTQTSNTPSMQLGSFQSNRFLAAIKTAVQAMTGGSNG